MTVFIEGLNLGDLLKYEAPNLYSRDLVTVMPEMDMQLGQVLARVDGNYYRHYDPDAGAESGVAAGILLTPVAAGLAPTHKLPVLVRHAIVADHALAWREHITAEQKEQAIAQLRAIGLLVRQGV